jgi:hypothetical protein
MPSARICLALVEIAIVADAGTLFALCDMDKIAKPPCYFILYESILSQILRKSMWGRHSCLPIIAGKNVPRSGTPRIGTCATRTSIKNAKV